MRETYCTRKELADLLGLTERQVVRKIARRKLPLSTKLGYPVLKSVRRYLASLLDTVPGTMADPVMEERLLTIWDNRAHDVEEAASDKPARGHA